MDGAADKEVLLFEAEFFAFEGLVVGVEDFRDGFAVGFFFDGAAIIAVIEDRKVKFFGSAGGPEAKGIDGIVIKSGDGDVKGDA